MNIGEELVAAYLEHIEGCEFIQTNLYTKDVQGEIDVVGINLKRNKIFICEVAIHLVTGLQYVKNARPNNVNKLTEKLSKDIEYANKYFNKYEKHFMLWSPIVKKGKTGSKHSQEQDIVDIGKNIKDKYNIDVEFIVMGKFLECINKLRMFAKTETKDIKSPVLRLYQIEESLREILGTV